MDDLVTLRMLVAANAGPVREALREAAAQAAVPFEFVEADDGARAAALIGGKPFDLVLLDCALGATDRLRVAEACRECSKPPLLVALASADEHLDPSFADAGARKPAGGQDAQKLVDGCVRALLPLNVLLVDDSATMRGIVRKILGATRFRVTIFEAEDGAAAFSHVKNGAVDIVFLDYNMPGLDGLAT